MSLLDNINGTIMDFLVSHFPSARGKNITADDALLNNGILDSMGMLDLVVYIEDVFKIAVNDEDLSLENFKTVNCIAEFVRRKSVESCN